jgi:hypothetical protein
MNTQIKRETNSSERSATQRRAAQRRRGSVVLLTAGGVLACLGFCALAVDYGTSVVVKNKLQRTCDAAALAGATELKRTGVDATDFANARARAINIAAQNGVTIASSDVTFPTYNTVRVGAVQQRRFLFGGAIGIPTGRVSAAAVAGRSYVRGITGALPLGITRKTYETYRPSSAVPNPGAIRMRMARNTQEKFGPMNSDDTSSEGQVSWDFLALDLRYGNSGNSGALFQDELANGSAQQTTINQMIDPLGSSITSQGNKLDLAIQERLQRSAGAPWFNNGSNYTFPNYKPDDPRLVWILVGDDGYPANNSNPQLNLKYFAPAYIERQVQTTGGGNNRETWLTIRLMPRSG